jgi:hypothetical protein
MDFCRVMLPTANIYAGIQGYALETRMNIGVFSANWVKKPFANKKRHVSDIVT